MSRPLGSMPGRGPKAGGRICRICRTKKPLDSYPGQSRRCLDCLPLAHRDGDAAEYQHERLRAEQQERANELRNREAFERLAKATEEGLAGELETPKDRRRPTESARFDDQIRATYLDRNAQEIRSIQAIPTGQ